MITLYDKKYTPELFGTLVRLGSQKDGKWDTIRSKDRRGRLSLNDKKTHNAMGDTKLIPLIAFASTASVLSDNVGANT